MMHLSGLFSEEQARSTAKYMEWLMRMDKDKDHIERTKRMIEVMQAYVDGEKIEYKLGKEWEVNERPVWNWPTVNYRIAKTPDTINWDHVAYGYKYMKRDENGFAYLYAEHPDSCIKVIRPESANGFSSYRRGTVDWEESLVIRPGCE